MNETQKATLKKIREQQNMVALSSVIQVWMSDLYDFQPGVRATLVTIAFLQITEESEKYPKDSPFVNDQIGWCWMTQKNLAARVGKSESQVQRDIQKFEADGVIEVRTWEDDNHTRHNEYHVHEDVVAARQREKGVDRPKRSKRDYTKYENKGAFKKGKDSRRANQDHPASDAVPPSISRSTIPHVTQTHAASHAVDHPASHALSTASDAVEGCSLVRSERSEFLSGGDAGRLPASAAPSAAGLETVDVIEYDTPKPNGLRSSGLETIKQSQKQDQSQRRKGVVTAGERKPLPNRLCYPDAFKGWKPGMRLPKCRVCHETLHAEENHACEGFKPLFRTIDPEIREAKRQSFDDFDDDQTPKAFAEEA